MTNRDEAFDCDTNTLKDLNEDTIDLEKKNATMGSSDLKRSVKTFEIDNISNADIQSESSSQGQAQIVSLPQNTVPSCDMVDIHGQKAMNLTDDKTENEANVDVDKESIDGEIKLVQSCDQVKDETSYIQPDKHDVLDENKTNASDKQRWKPFDFCMKKCFISKEELSHVVQTLRLEYTLMLILQSLFTDEQIKKIKGTLRWLFAFDCDILLDITLCAIPYIPGTLGLHIWNNTEIVRKILRDAMLRRVWLENEPFRLATFSLLRGLFPQVNSLHLARAGFFCDNDGQIRCYRCNRSSSTDNAEVHQLDCQAYGNTSETMADYGAHALRYIVPSSYRGHPNLRTNGMVHSLFRPGQTRSCMRTNEDITSETGRTISLRSHRNYGQESDSSTSPNFPDPNIPHQYPVMESARDPTDNLPRRRRNRNIRIRSSTNTSEMAPTYSLWRELSQNTVFEYVHPNTNQALNLVPGERRHAVCFPPSQDSVTRNNDNLRIPTHTRLSPDRSFSLNARHNHTSPCTSDNDLPPQLQGLDYINGNISAQTSTYREAPTTNECMINVNSHVRYQGQTFTETRNTPQYEQQSNEISSAQLEESMSHTREGTIPRTNNSPENDNGISKETLTRTSQHFRGVDLSERSKSPRTGNSVGAAETQKDNFQPDANHSENPNKSDKDYSAVAQQMPCDENLQACLTQSSKHYSRLRGIDRQQGIVESFEENDSNSAQSQKDRHTKIRNKTSSVKTEKQKDRSTQANVVADKENKISTGLPKRHQSNAGREHPTTIQEYLSNPEPRQVMDPWRASSAKPRTGKISNNPNTNSEVPPGVFFLLHTQENTAKENNSVSLRKKSKASTTNGNMFEDRNGEAGAHPNAQDTDDKTRCSECGNILKYDTETGQPAKCHPPCQ